MEEIGRTAIRSVLDDSAQSRGASGVRVDSSRLTAVRDAQVAVRTIVRAKVEN